MNENQLRNIHELQLRANWHAKQGHVMQGTYGDVSLNGHLDFRGCAVGCLSTPHRMSRLKTFLQKFMDSGGGLKHEGQGQRESLEKEFGLNYVMIACVEGLFEGQPTHGAAISFVRDFAHALREGAEITTQDIYTWQARALGIREDGWNEIHEALESYEAEQVETVTTDFLDYVGSFKPAEEKVAA